MTTTHCGSPRWGRLPKVMQMTHLGRSSIYLGMKLGKFPKCFKIGGGHAVAWNIDEVEAWMTARMAERDAQQPTH